MGLLNEDLKLAEELKAQRDEVKVRLHLLGMEAKDDWGDLEKKYELLLGRLKIASEAAERSSDDVRAAARSLADEIKVGYKRIKSSL